jgi:hypothetical protein
MDLPPLPADRQYELELQLQQLLSDHFWGPKPRQPQRQWPTLYIDTGFREDPERYFVDKTVSFTRDWFARLAIAYLGYWYEVRKSDSDWLPADWLPAVKAKAIDTARTVVWSDGDDRFDRVCLREVTAALEVSSNWFLVHSRYLEEQRLYAAKRRQRLAEERMAKPKPVPVEIKAIAAMAGISVKPLRIPAVAPSAETPLSDRKRKRSKPPARGMPPPALRPGHAVEIQQYKAKKGFTTDAQAARALGVSEDVLKSIKSRRGRLRCSQETEKAVLNKIAKFLKTP